MIVETPARIEQRRQLEATFELHSDAVFGFVLSRCGSDDVAQDVTSEVFIDAARRFAEGRGADVTRSWLVTVAHRRLIDHWRSVGSQRSRVDRLRNLRGTSSSVDLELIELALGTLPERQRAALALRYLDDFSVSEIADALDATYRSTESLLARARRNFARAYEEELRREQR